MSFHANYQSARGNYEIHIENDPVEVDQIGGQMDDWKAWYVRPNGKPSEHVSAKEKGAALKKIAAKLQEEIGQPIR